MNVLIEVEETLKNEIKRAIIQSGLASEAKIPQIMLEKPKEKSHGDFAANIAMQLARVAKMAPRKIAEQIVEQIDEDKANIEKIEIAGPGFINFFMKQDFLYEVIDTVLEQKGEYGKSNFGKNKRIQVEFVSVNPTGDLHLGHARGAAFGDALCNVLAAAGYEVEREYYINDAGNQIDKLAESIETRYMEALGKEAEMPEDGYYGQDIIEIGKELAEEHGDVWLQKDRKERLAFFRHYGLKYELGKIKADLDELSVSSLTTGFRKCRYTKMEKSKKLYKN